MEGENTKKSYDISECVAAFARLWVSGDTERAVKGIEFLDGKGNFSMQFTYFKNTCLENEVTQKKLFWNCERTIGKLSDEEAKLFTNMMYNKIKKDYIELEGALRFCEAFEEYQAGRFEKAFLLVGMARENILETERREEVLDELMSRIRLNMTKQENGLSDDELFQKILLEHIEEK